MLNTAFIASIRETAKKYNTTIKTAIKSPHEEKGLQVVDAVCWAMYQKLELNDESYYQLIQPLIREKMVLKLNEKPHTHGTPFGDRDRATP
jgi:hypothetical protein